MRLPRWVHRVWAAALGYFWLPCPMCGQNFGGHEWRAPYLVDPVTRCGICPSCVKAGGGVYEVPPGLARRYPCSPEEGQ